MKRTHKLSEPRGFQAPLRVALVDRGIDLIRIFESKRGGLQELGDAVPRPSQNGKESSGGDEALASALRKGTSEAGGAEPAEGNDVDMEEGRFGGLQGRRVDC